MTHRYRFSAVCVMLLGLALTLGVGGCAATYTVEIENTTSRAMDARLIQDIVAADPITLAFTRVPAGESSTLGPVKATLTDDVNLRVGQPTEAGLPDNGQRMYPGRSRYRIIESERGWSGIEVVPVK